MFSAYRSRALEAESEDEERTESAGDDDGGGEGEGEETESDNDSDEEEDDELTWTDAAGGRPCQIDARTVYEVHSYDLRGAFGLPPSAGSSPSPLPRKKRHDLGEAALMRFCFGCGVEDLLHVAFSEVTGRIVVGTRAGGVKVV